MQFEGLLKRVFLQDLLQKVSDQEGDSTDDEGIDQSYHSDDSEDLQFESDDEGNFKSIKANGKHVDDADTDEEGSEGDDEGEEEEEIDDADIEDISDEDAEEEEEDEEEDEDNSEEDGEDELNGLKKAANSEEKEEILTKKSKTKTANSTDTNKTKFALEKFDSELKKESKPKGSKKSANTATGTYQEYENSDTSDEEDIRNTVGNIPMHWYDEYKHIGYDWDAKKIIKPPKGDQIDDFLRKIEDPNFWRTVRDPQTGQEVILTDADIELIKRINSGRVPNPEHNEYEPWIEWFTSEVEKMPIKNVPDHKRSFLPSVSEKKKIGRMVHALKMGWMKTMEELEKEKKAKRGPKFYMLWETDTSREEMRRIHDPVSAPKRDLPGHAESYNPPPEYLFDEKEQKEWLKLKDEPHKRKLHFMPQKYTSLREVPAYSRYLRERFLRCLDLYLCPRAKRVKLNIDAEYLIPKLPSPKDLQPFPTVESLVYRGHTDLVRSVSVEPKGEYIVSGSDDKTVKSRYTFI